MTEPAILRLSDLTLSAVQGAAASIRVEQPVRANTADPMAIIDNLLAATANVTSLLVDAGPPGPDKDIMERRLLEVAAYACLAVEAGLRSRIRPRVAGQY